jgi:hypothetical protein
MLEYVGFQLDADNWLWKGDCQSGVLAQLTIKKGTDLVPFNMQNRLC